MSRSVKKGPYVEERLFNRVKAQLEITDKKVKLEVANLTTMITIEFVK